MTNEELDKLLMKKLSPISTKRRRAASAMEKVQAAKDTLFVIGLKVVDGFRLVVSMMANPAQNNQGKKPNLIAEMQMIEHV